VRRAAAIGPGPRKIGPIASVDCILEAGGLQPMTVWELVSPGSILSEGRGSASRSFSDFPK
jgi:hypothetical protein